MKSDNKDSDFDSFREAVSDVTPLKEQGRIEPVPRKTPARALQQPRDDRAVIRELLGGHEDGSELETGEELMFLRPGRQRRLLRRLRRGHYSIRDTIDLHHMDVATARQVLGDFLERALESNHSCVRIVHGKGLRSRDRPKLKPMVNRVLRKHPSVIAFASCRPVDGGTGAVSVLLSARSRRGR
jgi:DNA-nicking Smr family endonuclease